MTAQPTPLHRRTFLLGALGLPACAAASMIREVPKGGLTTATVLLVRHAEKQTGVEDPELSEAGLARSAALARLLASSAPSHLYSSEYRRTRNTLKPLELSAGLQVQTHPARDVAGQAHLLRALPPGSLAVVSGHSNTLPKILRALGAPIGDLDTHGYIRENVYHRLFILTLIHFEASEQAPTPSLLELRYDP